MGRAVIGTLVAAGAVLMMGSFPGPAAAATRPADTVKAVEVAARQNAFTAGIPGGVRVSHIRVSSSGRWASALDTPTRPVADPAQVLLAKVGRRWVAKDLGTAGVGCGVAPQRVRAELGLRGTC